MKKILLILSLIACITTNSQVKIFETRKQAVEALEGFEYKTSIGWTIKVGDDIVLGRGSMPDKTFAFVTESPNLLTYNQYTDYDKKKLQHTCNGSEAKIADLIAFGQ